MTFRLLATLLLSLTFAACGGPNFMDKTKIDGSILRGSAVLPGDQLYGRTVYIAKNFTYDDTTPSLFRKFGLCSGVILHERYILTAAHCTQNLEESRVIFTEDVNQPLLPDQIYQIKDFKIPDEYQEALKIEKEKFIVPGPASRSNQFDLAILKLSRPIIGAKFSANYFQEKVSLMHMTTSKDAKMTVSAFVAGYGRITEYTRIQDDPRFQQGSFVNNPPPLNGTLMKAKLTLNIADLSNKVISRSQRFSAGVCGGDSGAPVFVDRDGEDYLQAIAIATYKVKTEDPVNMFNTCYGDSLFLNLDFHKNWIFKTMLQLEKSKINLIEAKTI